MEFNIPGLKEALEQLELFKTKTKEAATELLEVAMAGERVMKTFGDTGTLKDYVKLQKTAKEETDKLELAKKRLAVAESEEAKEIAKVNYQIQLLNKETKYEIINTSALTSEYTKLNNKRAEAKNKLRDLMAAENANTKEVNEARRAFEELNKKVLLVDHTVGDFTKNVGNYPFSTLTNSIKNFVAAFGIVGGIQAFASVLKDAYKTIKEFDQGLADLSAITGASGKDLNYLRDQAIDLGRNVKGGAVAVVEAYKLIASAKPELLENVQALNEVTSAAITLSKAAGMELPAAATALTDAMNQFNAPASQASVFIDALANGAKYGAAEIPDVTEALLKFGAVARTSNVSIHESVGLIELLAENGIKGADAGTALRNVLLKISAPDALPRQAQQAMKDLGVSFEVLKDKSVPIQEKFEALKPLLADNGKLLKAFGFENVVAATNIISHTDRLGELIDKMNEVGTADEQAAIRADTLQGKTDKLASTYDSFILSMNKGKGPISEFFKFFVEGASGALDGLIRLNTSWDELHKKAKQDGTGAGTKSFLDQFNSLAGTGTDAEIASSILTVAEKNYKLFEQKMKENQANEKKMKEGGGALKGIATLIGLPTLGSGYSQSELNGQKEELIKNLNEQAEIIRKARSKIRGDKEVLPGDAPANAASPLGESDADREKRLKKQESDAKKAIDIEKKSMEMAITAMKMALDFKIATYDQSQHLDEDNIAFIQAVSLMKQNILEAELKKDLLGVQMGSENELNIRKAHASEVEKIESEKSKALMKVSQERANFELELYDINNKSILEEAKDLTDLLIEEEKRRLKESLQIHKDHMREELGIDADTTDEKLKLYAKTHAQLTANERKYLKFILNEEEKTNKAIKKADADLLASKLKVIDKEIDTEVRKHRLLRKGTQSNTIFELKEEEKKLLKQRELYKDDADKTAEIDLALAENKDKLNQFISESKRESLELGLNALMEIAGKESVIGKAAAIAQVTINTIEGASKEFAKGGILGFATGALITAAGAVQIAKIAGVQLFEKGTKFAPYTGKAVVDEAGPEIHMDRFGKIKSFGSEGGAHFTDIVQGDQIIPADISAIIKKTMFASYGLDKGKQDSIDYAEMGKYFDKSAGKIVNAINNKRESTTNILIQKDLRARTKFQGNQR